MMATAENPHAGRGSVVLDIGGDIGALIVTMPPWMEGLEVEIIPAGTDSRHVHHHSHDPDPETHEHDDGHHSHDDVHGVDGDDHHHGHEHDHDHTHDHDDGADDGHGHLHAPGAPPHVAVVPRPAPDGSIIHSLVYGELKEGTYDLYVRPDGEIQLTATVVGGQITETSWPETARPD